MFSVMSSGRSNMGVLRSRKKAGIQRVRKAKAMETWTQDQSGWRCWNQAWRPGQAGWANHSQLILMEALLLPLGHTDVQNARSLQPCLTLCDAMICSPPGSSVHRFSRQEYWSGLPCPPPGDLPTQRSNPRLLQLLHCRQYLYCQATK